MTNEQRDEALQQISENVAALRTYVEQDHKAIYGNGQKGLIDRMTTVESDISHMRMLMERSDTSAGIYQKQIAELEKHQAVMDTKMDTKKAIVGFIVNFALTVACALLSFFKR